MAPELMNGLREAASLAVVGLILVHSPLTRAAEPTAAEELVREGYAHDAAHDYDVALKRFAEALSLDPTLETAYLGLGSLRMRMGDVREAERVYDAALMHVASFPQAKLGRAEARRALGELHDADEDLEAYVAKVDDAAALRLLARWYADEGRPLAQLAAWRRVLSRAETRDDAVARKEARLTVHALELIVAGADPVRAPPGEGHASSVRRGMARMEGRR